MTALDKEKLLKALENATETFVPDNVSDVGTTTVLAINGTYWKLIAKIREGIFDLKEEE